MTVQIKTEIQRAGKPKEEADLKRLVETLRSVGYRGYIALEYERRGGAEGSDSAAHRNAEEIDGLSRCLPLAA